MRRHGNCFHFATVYLLFKKSIPILRLRGSDLFDGVDAWLRRVGKDALNMSSMLFDVPRISTGLVSTASDFSSVDTSHRLTSDSAAVEREAEEACSHHVEGWARTAWLMFCQDAIVVSPFLIGDAIVAAVCLYTASLLTGTSISLSAEAPMPLSILLISSLLLGYSFAGMYSVVGLHPANELRRCTIGNAIALLGVLAVALLQPSHVLSALTMTCLLALTIAFLAVPIVRFGLRSWLARTSWWGQPAMIFGTGMLAQETFKWLESNPSLGVRPIGFVDDLAAAKRGAFLNDPRFLGPPSSVKQLMDRHRAFWALVDASGESHRISETLRKRVRAVPHVVVLNNLPGMPTLSAESHAYVGASGIRIKDQLLFPGPRLAKRVFDLLATIVGGILISPLLAALALSIKAFDPGPILFGQERIGIGGRRFIAWKFRTMVVNNDKILADYLASNEEERLHWEEFHKLRKDPRITWIGHLLRRTSLDELPQLWNVLTGEMSLVGPRPMYAAEIASYAASNADYGAYLMVRPGITGLWQVSGRATTTFQRRAQLDEQYVRNWSIWLDFYILIRTIKTVALREGAS